MKMTSEPWQKRASQSKVLARKYAAVVWGVICVTARGFWRGCGSATKFGKGFFARKFNGAAVLVTLGAAIVSISVAAIYRPAGGILWGLFIILAAIDMRR
jgi:adenine/guanine phosphoribosyltransferase-like PRPP-binding protein